MSGLLSCAILHSTQITDIDSATVKNGSRFNILLSETGVNLKEASKIAQAITNDQKTRQDIKELNAIISLFQMGPTTGNMVFNDTYADYVVDLLRAKCPSGKISGLMSIRETAKYPVVSGEIVRLVGYCQN